MTMQQTEPAEVEPTVSSSRRNTESVQMLTARAAVVVDELNDLLAMLADMAVYSEEEAEDADAGPE